MSTKHGEVGDRLGDVAVAHVARLAAALVVLGLENRELVVLQLELGLLGLDVVEPRIVAAEDCALHRAVRGTERGEAVFLLHVLGDLEAAQALDLPLRRAGPHGVGAPAHAVDTHLLDHDAHQGGGDPRLGDHGHGEELAYVGIDVVDAVDFRDVGEVAGPGDAAGTLELLQRHVRIAADVAVGAVIDDEVELRPVFRRLAHIAGVDEAAQVRKLPVERGGEQALVDADVLDAGLDELLVALVGDLLVVHAPGIAADLLVGVVADRVALHRLGLELKRGVDLLQPARLARREDRVREQAPRAEALVHLVARLRHLLVGEEPVLLDVGRRRRNQHDLGVAVEEHLLDVVVVLEVLDGLFLAGELLVPAGLADRRTHVDEALDARVVAQEMRVHVHDELVFERIRALLRHRRRRRLGAAHVEEAAEGLVQGHVGGGHAGRGLEELPSRKPLLLRELLTDIEQARLELALLLGLREGKVFVARYDLRRDRRVVGQQLGRRQLGTVFVAQETHRTPPGHCESVSPRRPSTPLVCPLRAPVLGGRAPPFSRGFPRRSPAPDRVYPLAPTAAVR